MAFGIKRRFGDWTWSPGAWKRVFGFKPDVPLGAVDHAVREVEQRLVDRVLQRLAQAFHEVCGRQNALHLHAKESPSAQTLKDLKDVRYEVGYKKDWFWRAHGMAAEAGYHVHERYSDYLVPEPDLI